MLERFLHSTVEIIAIVHAYGGHPQKIELEVTERVLLDEDGGIANALRRLRDAGFRIALDEFGTGYSSLGYLHRFEVDKIKIDRSPGAWGRAARRPPWSRRSSRSSTPCP